MTVAGGYASCARIGRAENLEHRCRRSPEIVTRCDRHSPGYAVATLGARAWLQWGLQWGSGQAHCSFRHLEQHRKFVCLGRAPFSGCRPPAHEGVRVEPLEIRGD